jgi:hypothetical protein
VLYFVTVMPNLNGAAQPGVCSQRTDGRSLHTFSGFTAGTASRQEKAPEYGTTFAATQGRA